MKLLQIIDPQVDFIEGSLKVKGATMAINKLCEFIDSQDMSQIDVAISFDWHPSNHCSFETQGGQWPPHCIQHTIGAAMSTHLSNTLIANGVTDYITELKGEIPEIEEYSFVDQLVRTEALDEFTGIINEGYDTVYVAGIAGDYCVLESLKGLKDVWDKVIVLKDCVASIDDGSTLENFCKENNIRYE